jgi:hypothetical protein
VFEERENAVVADPEEDNLPHNTLEAVLEPLKLSLV